MNTNIDSVSDAQWYLHSLIKSADEFNKTHQDQKCTPKWAKAMNRIERYKKDINWEKLYNDPHFTKDFAQRFHEEKAQAELQGS